MSDDRSLVTRPKDYSDIAKFDLDELRDPTVLEEFLQKPLTYIAESVTGALSVGKTGVAVAGGRIVQAILKGQTFKQFGAEFRKLRDAGKIPEDFAEKRYGFQTWVELMTIIDEESPDQDRLDALKAMFYAVNKTNAADGERIAAYHLWQIAKTLSSGELLVLRTLMEPPGAETKQGTHVFNFVAQNVGHGIQGLVAIHYKKLDECGLVMKDHGMITTTPPKDRVTPLGKKVCENIKNYQIALQDDASSSS
jgi:hypothetical protein